MHPLTVFRDTFALLIILSPLIALLIVRKLSIPTFAKIALGVIATSILAVFITILWNSTGLN